LITRDTIEEVKNRIDIVDVISDFITLKKSGANYKALSPFANEKTPSFFVVPAKGIFKDFSSGKGGDAFSFVMEHEKLSYAEAIRYLAKKYGVEIKEDKISDEGKAEQSEREGLYILMNFAKEYYKNILHTHDEGMGIGLSYFRERGFTDRTIEKFELGFALEGWEYFSKEAIAKGYNKELLEKTGLVVKKEDSPDGTIRTYDRFRGRVIFPVHNISGKVIAFGARMMGKEKNQPKYINSPETDIYHKSDVLYGLYQGKNSIVREENCYLVEGYADVLSMHQSGIENVVASSGTALTENQIRLIRRFSKKITILFDGDSAGIKAAIRGIDLVLTADVDIDIYAASFPDGEDPDSYSRKVSSTEFKNYLLKNTKDFIEFKVGVFAINSITDPIEKAEQINSIVKSIALLSNYNHNKKQQYITRVSSLLGVQESFLLGELNKIIINNRKETSKESRDFQKKVLQEAIVLDLTKPFVDLPSAIQKQERETLRLLLNYADSTLNEGDLISFIVRELEDVTFTNVTYNDIIKEFRENFQEGKIVTSQYFLESPKREIVEVVADLIAPRYNASQHWGDKFHIYFSKEADVLNEMALTNVLRLKFRVVQKMMEDNLQLVKQAELSDDLDLLDKSLETQTGLKKAETELAGLLGIVVAK
jgi:DNA primase